MIEKIAKEIEECTNELESLEKNPENFREHKVNNYNDEIEKYLLEIDYLKTRREELKELFNENEALKINESQRLYYIKTFKNYSKKVFQYQRELLQKPDLSENYFLKVAKFFKVIINYILKSIFIFFYKKYCSSLRKKIHLLSEESIEIKNNIIGIVKNNILQKIEKLKEELQQFKNSSNNELKQGLEARKDKLIKYKEVLADPLKVFFKEEKELHKFMREVRDLPPEDGQLEVTDKRSIGKTRDYNLGKVYVFLKHMNDLNLGNGANIIITSILLAAIANVKNKYDQTRSMFYDVKNNRKFEEDDDKDIKERKARDSQISLIKSYKKFFKNIKKINNYLSETREITFENFKEYIEDFSESSIRRYKLVAYKHLFDESDLDYIRRMAVLHESFVDNERKRDVPEEKHREEEKSAFLEKEVGRADKPKHVYDDLQLERIKRIAKKTGILDKKGTSYNVPIENTKEQIETCIGIEEK